MIALEDLFKRMTKGNVEEKLSRGVTCLLCLHHLKPEMVHYSVFSPDAVGSQTIDYHGQMLQGKIVCYYCESHSTVPGKIDGGLLIKITSKYYRRRQ